MGKFARSWELVKASAAVLQADKALMLFPLISAVCSLLVIGSFAFPVIAFLVHHHTVSRHGMSAGGYVVFFAFYLVQYSVIIFFNTALVGAAMIRLRGGDPTLRDGMQIALSRLPSIAGYALISATVGMFLRALQERLGFVGRLIAGLLGVGWTVATFLVVPVLANENIGPVDAIKRSVTLTKTTWGENIIGNAGIGLVLGLFTIVAMVGGFALIFAAAATQSLFAIGAAVVLCIMTAVVLGLVQASLHGIYSAAVYRYAQDGESGDGFSQAMLESAFRQK
jgi:hypothetical protein